MECSHVMVEYLPLTVFIIKACVNILLFCARYIACLISANVYGNFDFNMCVSEG